MEIDLFKDLDRIHAPRQKRSRKVFELSLTAFDELLQSRPFADVGVQDVADHAGVSVTSVYARFDGKAALVLALHELARDRGLSAAQQVIEADRRDPMPLPSAVHRIVSLALDFADGHEHIFRAMLAAADAETLERAADFSRAMSEQLAVLLVPKLSGDPDSAARDVDFAWRSVLAVLQQAWMLGGEQPSRFPLTRDEKLARLVAQFLAHLSA